MCSSDLLILTKYFMFIVLFSWICVLLLRFELYVARIWVGFMFVEFGCLGVWVLLSLILGC